MSSASIYRTSSDQPFIEPLDDKDIARLARIKHEMLPKSFLYSAAVVGVFEGTRLLIKKLSFFDNPLKVDLPDHSAQLRIQTLRYGRYLVLSLGIVTSFLYFSMKYTNERYIQCAKYNDLLNAYLDFKDRKLNMRPQKLKGLPPK